MKKQCVLKNLRSEKGYKLPIDISHNLLNNIRVWCMNSKDKMAYYIAPDVIDCINRDGWPENFNVHAVYYYQGIKHDISEKDVLSTVLPDLNNIVLGMECNGYLPNEMETGLQVSVPLLLEDGIKADSTSDIMNIFETTSKTFFYDDDLSAESDLERYHTVEGIDQDADITSDGKDKNTQVTSGSSQKIDDTYRTLGADGLAKGTAPSKTKNTVVVIGLVIGLIIIGFFSVLAFNRVSANKRESEDDRSTVGVDFVVQSEEEQNENIESDSRLNNNIKTEAYTIFQATNVYNSQSLAADVVGVFAENDTVDVVSKTDEWVAVLQDGIIVYIPRFAIEEPINEENGLIVDDKTDDASVGYEEKRAFYGIWIGASKSENDANRIAETAIEDGIDAEVYITTDWSNLNSEKYYVITAGTYETKEMAQNELSSVKSKGYNDAYVKYSGDHK